MLPIPSAVAHTLRGLRASALLTAALVVVASCSARTPILDVTEPLGTTWALLGGGPTRPGAAASSPIRIELLRTDRRTYFQKEVVVYDVRITSISSTTIAIPWARSRTFDGPYGAVISLIATARGMPDFVLGSVSLLGSPSVPGSLLPLAPGHSAVVRLPAILSGYGPQDDGNPVLHPRPGVHVRAGVLIETPGAAPFAAPSTLRSREALPIPLRPLSPRSSHSRLLSGRHASTRSLLRGRRPVPSSRSTATAWALLPGVQP
jgi:hypothetical protein